MANLYVFAPTAAMLKAAKRLDGRKVFARLYRERLEALGMGRVVRIVSAFADDRDVVHLLCFEDLR